RPRKPHHRRPALGGPYLKGIEPVRRVTWENSASEWRSLLRREWILTNGLGGYASRTLSGAQTRRYHGDLIAALPPPMGRIVMLAGLEERIGLPAGREVRLGGEERPEALELHGARHLREFRLDHGQAVWTYDFAGVRIEKRLLLVNQKNLATVTWE